MTIESAEEFIRLRTSEDEAEYRRAASEEAPDQVWAALIEQHPEVRFWVAQNKTSPFAGESVWRTRSARRLSRVDQAAPSAVPRWGDDEAVIYGRPHRSTRSPVDTARCTRQLVRIGESLPFFVV